MCWLAAKGKCPCRLGTAGRSGDGPGDSVTEGVLQSMARRLRALINAMFEDHPVVTASRPETANVMDYLPEDQTEQVKTAMRAVWRLGANGGMARRKRLAEWFGTRSLKEGLEEINLDVPPSLHRCFPIHRCHRVPIPAFAWTC